MVGCKDVWSVNGMLLILRAKHLPYANPLVGFLPSLGLNIRLILCNVIDNIDLYY